MFADELERSDNYGTDTVNPVVIESDLCSEQFAEAIRRNGLAGYLLVDRQFTGADVAIFSSGTDSEHNDIRSVYTHSLEYDSYAKDIDFVYLQGVLGSKCSGKVNNVIGFGLINQFGNLIGAGQVHFIERIIVC